MASELDDEARLVRFRRENELIAEAMRLALNDAIMLHKRAGLPLVTWQDGQVVLIPSEDLMPVDKT